MVSQAFSELEGYSRDNDCSCNGSRSEQSHFPRKMAHSKLEMACCTLQKKAWLLATRSIPSRTGMLNACVEYSKADRRLSLRSMSGNRASPAAIVLGSRDSRCRCCPMSSESRTYATTNKALEVKGIGPLSLLGSRIDSGVCCHSEVHERSARLTVCNSAAG